ncbi:MAG: leucine-rich repeat protein, partial [Synergistaceae bacterium]|nr:leucine-rich repeat protein [Synergistaceae bacterium]
MLLTEQNRRFLTFHKLALAAFLFAALALAAPGWADGENEAKIGETEYATLQEAFNNAEEGATVTLLRDVEQTETLDPSHAASLSLNLNGKTLLFNSGQATNFKYFMYDYERMVITGSGTIEAKGLNESGNATILWRFCRDGDANTGTLTILDDAAMSNIKNIADCPWAAFTNSITAAVLNEGVTKIGVVTFCACKNLKTITLPASVKSIIEDSSGLLPFDRCPKLEKIMVADGNTVYSNNNGDGVLYTKDKTTLIFCPRGKTGTLTVPAEVTFLKKYSFNNADPKYNSTMRLSSIEFARTEPGTLSMDSAFASYTGDCVLVAPDGMLIDNQKQVLVSTVSTEGSKVITFRAVTAWDDLQDALSKGKGGTVTLTRSYDYTEDSYEINGWGGPSHYGKLIVPKGTVLDLNGYTLAAVDFYGDGEFTVKGGTLNCTRLRNNEPPTNATYGTLTLDDATVTADQLLWLGGMALTESTLTVGESEEGAGNNGKNINVTWVQPESGAMLTMDTASSVTLPQQQETDGKWRLTDFQTSEDVAAAAKQLGAYLPRGWTFETITGTRVYGMSEQPYYALAVKDAAGAYPASVTLKVPVEATPDAPTGLKATYGQTLADVKFQAVTGGTWAWDAPTTSVGNVGTKSFPATFTPTDVSYNTVKSANVSVTVSKATPTVNAPTGLKATYGQTLADVTLPQGWKWNDPAASVGNVGTNTFKATFTPADTANYNTVTENVTVTVNAKPRDTGDESGDNGEGGNGESGKDNNGNESGNGESGKTDTGLTEKQKAAQEELKQETEQKAAEAEEAARTVDTSTQGGKALADLMSGNAQGSKSQEEQQATQAAALEIKEGLEKSGLNVSEMSTHDVEMAVENKAREREEKVLEADGEVKDSTVPAATNLMAKSDNAALNNADLSVSPKVVTPVAASQEEAKETAKKLDETAKQESGDNVNGVDKALVQAAANNMNSSDDITIKPAPVNVVEQAKAVEELIRKVIETLRDQNEVLASALPEMTAQEDGFYLLNINLRNLLPGQEPQLWLSEEDYNNHQAAGKVSVSLAAAAARQASLRTTESGTALAWSAVSERGTVASQRPGKEGDHFFLDEDDVPTKVVRGDASKMKVVAYLKGN